jgi:hypothetical protein
MYYDVFIIHHESTELELAIKIKEELWRRRDIIAFVAKEDIPPGAPDPDEVITSAIKNSASVLVLYNKSASESDDVKGEMLKAKKDFKKEVIVFKEKGVERSKIPNPLRSSQTPPDFDIKNPEDLIYRALELRLKKNPNTIPEYHELYEKAKQYRILNPTLIGDYFLKELKEKLHYVFMYKLREESPTPRKYVIELKNLIKKMLDENMIEKTREYDDLERREGAKKALYILSVGIWKEGIHKSIF